MALAINNLVNPSVKVCTPAKPGKSCGISQIGEFTDFYGGVLSEDVCGAFKT